MTETLLLVAAFETQRVHLHSDHLRWAEGAVEPVLPDEACRIGLFLGENCRMEGGSIHSQRGIVRAKFMDNLKKL